MLSKPRLGVALAKVTGERRIVTYDQWAELESTSQARWEFLLIDHLDPATGEPDPEELRSWGFTPGGPTVIPGELEEVEPGMFRFVAESADTRQGTRLET
jgi:hypothetical protein